MVHNGQHFAGKKRNQPQNIAKFGVSVECLAERDFTAKFVVVSPDKNGVGDHHRQGRIAKYSV